MLHFARGARWSVTSWKEASKPIYRDETLGLWVTSSANAVRAVLTSDLYRVRPQNEPIPKALLGSPAASIFGHLVRWNEVDPLLWLSGISWPKPQLRGK